MQINYIISPAVGAIIGYFTNWLAIKMLFRPHTEKRIGKFRVPFTPGLIPKERHRIAEKIGEAVGTHLLNEDVLMEEIFSENMNEKITMWIEEYLLELQSKEDTLYSTLNAIFKEESDTVIHRMHNEAAEWLQKQLQNETIREKIIDIVFSEDVVSMLEENCYKLLRTELTSLQQREESIKEMFPDAAIETIRSYIIKHTPQLTAYFIEYLKKPTTEEKLKVYISGLISAKLGSFVSSFINIDSIYEGLTTEAEKYLQEEQMQLHITNELLEGLEQILSMPMKGILRMDEEQISSISQWVTQKSFTGENISLLKEKLNIQMKHMVGNEKTVAFLREMILLGSQSILYLPVKEITKNFDVEDVHKVRRAIMGYLHSMLRTKAKDIVKTIDVSAIVEKRVNSFDVAFAEEIILSISDKELQAITWLGGLLGFILGFITPLLS